MIIKFVLPWESVNSNWWCWWAMRALKRRFVQIEWRMLWVDKFLAALTRLMVCMLGALLENTWRKKDAVNRAWSTVSELVWVTGNSTSPTLESGASFKRTCRVDTASINAEKSEGGKSCQSFSKNKCVGLEPSSKGGQSTFVTSPKEKRRMKMDFQIISENAYSLMKNERHWDARFRIQHFFIRVQA